MNKNWDKLSELSIEEEVYKDSIEELKPQISWRGDGKFYSVNTLDSNGKRHIFVLERDGKVVSKSERTVGECLNWRPDGSIITTNLFSKEEKETKIMFFEKNGLQHYEFKLDDNEAFIESIEWNLNSELLKIHYKNEKGEKIQIWYRSNYHWYLKQEIKFQDKKILFSEFDKSKPLKLHLFLDNQEQGEYHCYQFNWENLITNNLTIDDPCFAFVINGNKILVTFLRYSIVPPPMSNTEFVFEKNINYVTFNDKNFEFLVQFSDGSVSICKIDFDKESKFEIKYSVLNETEDGLYSNFRQYYLTNKGYFMIEPTNNMKNENLIFYDFEKKENKKISFDKKIMKLIKNNYFNEVLNEKEESNYYLELFDGSIVELDGSLDSRVIKSLKFNYACEDILLFKNTSKKEEEDESMSEEEKKGMLFIGLSSRGILQVNSNIIVSNCTSFMINEDFLLFTTSNHELRIIRLTNSTKIVEESNNFFETKSDKGNESQRSIERGGKLIKAIVNIKNN
jgi:elongator complex protein 1